MFILDAINYLTALHLKCMLKCYWNIEPLIHIYHLFTYTVYLTVHSLLSADYYYSIDLFKYQSHFNLNVLAVFCLFLGNL